MFNSNLRLGNLIFQLDFMEKISAACAMEWSIELDKGLRSRKPGAAVEAVKRIGPRLERWGSEPEYTMAAYNMFGLVPGEDRLFASAILLKLAEAFRVGDKEVRRAVVDLFLSDVKKKRKRRGRKGVFGVLSKCVEETCLELLRSVKDVFDREGGGDVELRADCLVLFGCWADFSAENADVRHLILASLGSVHDMEVLAALFAVGCFCEQSDDFAFIVLHILINLVASTKTSLNVKLAGIQIFGKMHSSFVITHKAYKAALTLMQNTTNEDVFVGLLMTLSKLACKTIILVSEQMNLLCSVLKQETTLRTKTTALRSLVVIYNSGCYFHVSAQLFESLLSLILHPQVQDTLQNLVLEILHKILSQRTVNMSLMDMIDSSRLLDTLQSVCQSQSSINRVLAIEIMASTTSKLLEEIEDESSKISLLSDVMYLTVEQTSILCLQGLGYSSQFDSEKEREGLSLFKILIFLVRKHPEHRMFVVDKICLLIERMTAESERTTMVASQPCQPAYDITISNVNKIESVRCKLLQGICRVLFACLDVIFEVGAVNTELTGKVISALRLACEISYKSCSTILDFLPLHPCISWTTLRNKNCLLDKKAIWDDYSSEIEILALECSKSILAAQAYWPAYRYGVCAAYQGVYVVLIFILQHLMTKVPTGIYFYWLKSLVEFAYSEWWTEHLLPKASTTLENWLKTNNDVIVHPWHNMGHMTKGAFSKMEISEYSRIVLQKQSYLSSALKMLDSGTSTNEVFYFQKWFLSLRAKLNDLVLQFLNIMSSQVTSQETAGSNEHVEYSILHKCTISGQSVSSVSSGSVFHLSSRLNSLALDFDLMLTSFLDLDKRSMSIISALSLSSSVLAFGARYLLGFPEVFPCVSGCSIGTDNFSDAALAYNFLNRLTHADEETIKNIGVLLKILGLPKGCVHLPSRTQMLASFITKELTSICNHAMTGVAGLQKDISSISQNHNLKTVAKARVELMSDIFTRWLAIPFGIPKSYFHSRPLSGSYIYVMNSDNPKPDCLSTTVGGCLALNVCVQLKNFPSQFSPRIKKLFCILQCRPSFSVSKLNDNVRGGAQSASQPWELDYLVDLNQKLLHHVTECKASGSYIEEMADKGAVYAYMFLELNENHQGFSTTMLDVSGFPSGSFKTRWLSCYLDERGSYWNMLPLNAGPIITVYNVDKIPSSSELK